MQTLYIFSCEEAALEVQMSLCLSVYQVEIQPVIRGMYRTDILSKRNVRGRTLQLRGM